MEELSFGTKVRSLGLNRKSTEILQVNIGRKCNQACHHCHVEAGPSRLENMEADTVDRIIQLLAASDSIHTLDLTGGAPELNPHFRRLVVAARRLDKKVIDRCNLTVLFLPGQEDTIDFLKNQAVDIVASLPCYSKSNVEQQRGRGVFGKSIEALKLLNNQGFGVQGSGLNLDLVYNPIGPFLPPDQVTLEAKYRVELRELFGLEFNRLFTITNMPIKRFLNDLLRMEKLESYMDLLANSFNPAAASEVMCRHLLSVSWNGELHDCDFNQMLEMPLGFAKKTIWDVESFSDFSGQRINFRNHCYACTAGAGSSCGGTLT